MPPKSPPSHTAASLDFLNPEFWRRLGSQSLDSLWDIVKIIALYLVVRWALRKLVSRIVVPIIRRSEGAVDAAQAAQLRTLTGLLNSIVSYILIFIFGVMLLRVFRLDPIPLLTTASVAGLAVGFGAQKLVKDVISGFFILLENQYAVGDYVTIGAVTGTVEDVGMRTTRIRDEAGKLYILSNGDISLVCNQSRGTVDSFVEISISPASDLEKATLIINSAGIELAESQPALGFAKPPSVQGLGSMDGAKLTLRVACPAVSPIHLTKAQFALRGLIHQKLAEAGIPLA